MRDCIVLASIASRKPVAIAKSIKSLLKLAIVGVAHTHHPHIFSRYFDKVHMVRVNRDSNKWVYLVADIAKMYRCRAVLPIDFIDFYIFSKNRRYFEDLDIVLISPPHESIVLASDRVRCSEILGDIALYPHQVFIEKEDDVEKIYSLEPPIVVKDLSDASNPSFHLGYETAVREALSRSPVVVQEYIEGIARGYYALAFNGVPIIEFTHQRVVEYTPIGGASLAAQGIVKDPRLIELGRKIVDRLRWSGVLMVETRYTDEFGDYYIIELNPKFWGSINLSESLGYRFSALLVALYLYGVDRALELKERLYARDGSFVWLLDGFRYLPKIPRTWLKLIKASLSNPIRSDVDLSDGPRVVIQIIKALQKFRSEKNRWIQYLSSSREQLNTWFNRFQKFLLSSKKVVVSDFDATLVKLPINWVKLRRLLIEKGFLHKWETINRALTRYWNIDLDLYQKLSDVVKQYELRAVDSVELLVEPNLLNELRKHTKICIATKQPTDVVTIILDKIGLSNTIDYIVGRDSGFGPIKKILYKKCIELCKGDEAIVIDDNLEYLVEAYRLGYIPIHATSDLYSIARSYRIGIPAEKTNKLISFIISTIERASHKKN
ncbi:MAG: hypothetical protein QXI86_04590 [Ignisphaera sp.]